MLMVLGPAVQQQLMTPHAMAAAEAEGGIDVGLYLYLQLVLKLICQGEHASRCRDAHVGLCSVSTAISMIKIKMLWPDASAAEAVAV
jgi:hypothetical protein